MNKKDLYEMKVFAVDDHQSLTDLVKNLLEEIGFDNLVEFSKSADLFVALESGNIPDLILSDIMMPDINGYELCKRIKSNPKWCEIPIIMITAADSRHSEPLRLSFEAGAMDYIQKPINHVIFHARVKSALIIERQKKQLKQALKDVTTLQGLLPICSYCKKIRDEKDKWSDIDEYVSKHSNVQFSHSCCPDCYQNIVKPELDDLKEKRKQRLSS